MSLKAFHLFFILVSILFLIGFGLWFLFEQPLSLESLNVFAGLVSFSLGGGLVLYAVRFLKKFKSLRNE
ncbi:MAG: hypothetical protein HYW57_01425 [Ignavibacteriales bacterium]|nr:hypothetical protein [Ignavibacteriales bacterium]